MIRLWCLAAAMAVAIALRAGETPAPPPGEGKALPAPATAVKAEQPPAAEVSTPASSETATVLSQEAPARDPFQPPPAEEAAGSEAGLVAAAVSEIPTGIRVVGIARAAGRPPVAIISIPGCPENFFVREQEVIRLELSADEPASMASPSPPSAPAATPEMQRLHPELRSATAEGSRPAGLAPTTRRRTRILYLYISKIDGMTVEAYPRARPDDKQIFR